MKYQLSFLLVLLSLSSFAQSRGTIKIKKPDFSLVGKWNSNSESQYTIELKKDSTYTIFKKVSRKADSLGKDETGTWSYTKNLLVFTIKWKKNRGEKQLYKKEKSRLLNFLVTINDKGLILEPTPTILNRVGEATRIRLKRID